MHDEYFPGNSFWLTKKFCIQDLILRKQKFSVEEASILRDFFVVDQNYLDQNNIMASQQDGGKVGDLGDNREHGFGEKL